MANKMPSDYLKDIDKAFDRATRRLVIETQSKLSEAARSILAGLRRPGLSALAAKSIRAPRRLG